MPSNLFLTSDVEQNVVIANSQIAINSGIPTADGSTLIWANVTKAYNQDKWFIPMPPPDGWNGISQETMMTNVINVNQEPYDPNWYPPIVPPTSIEEKPRVRL